MSNSFSCRRGEAMWECVVFLYLFDTEINIKTTTQTIHFTHAQTHWESERFRDRFFFMLLFIWWWNYNVIWTAPHSPSPHIQCCVIFSLSIFRNTWRQAWRYSMIQTMQKIQCTTISVFMERYCSIAWVCRHNLYKLWLKFCKLFHFMSFSFIHYSERKKTHTHTPIHTRGACIEPPVLCSLCFHSLSPEPDLNDTRLVFEMVFLLILCRFFVCSLFCCCSRCVRKTTFICISGADNYLFCFLLCISAIDVCVSAVFLVWLGGFEQLWIITLLHIYFSTPPDWLAGWLWCSQFSNLNQISSNKKKNFVCVCFRFGLICHK